MSLLNLSGPQQSALRWMRIYSITPFDARAICCAGHVACSISKGGTCAVQAQKILDVVRPIYNGPERRRQVAV